MRLSAIWFADASGQTLRQKPGATKKSSGSSGSIKPQKMKMPTRAEKKSEMHNASAAATLAMRSTSHTLRVTRGLICMKFGKSGSIVSVSGEALLPTGNKARGLGSGVTIFETFATYGQILPANSFFQSTAPLPTQAASST